MVKDGFKVCVIDDNKDYLFAMETFLTRNGFEVTTAEEGESGTAGELPCAKVGWRARARDTGVREQEGKSECMCVCVCACLCVYMRVCLY